MERRNYSLDNDTIDNLDMLHKLTGINRSKLIRMALKLLIDKMVGNLNK